MFVKRRVIESALGQTANQRHLPAFKSETDAATGTRLLSFVAFSARLTVAGAFATAKPLDAMTRTRPRPQIMQAYHDGVAAAFPSPPLMPRTFKISSRRRNPRNASIVAFTTLA